jgi:hypothetical protein
VVSPPLDRHYIRLVRFPWLTPGLREGRRRALEGRRFRRSPRETEASRLGFEPRTRGSKVSPVAVHRVVWGTVGSTLRAVGVHQVHGMGPPSTAVAVSGAVFGRGRYDRDRLETRLREYSLARACQVQIVPTLSIEHQPRDKGYLDRDCNQEEER